MTDFAPLPAFDPVPRQAVYLGLDPRDGHRPCWSSPEDSVGIVGPPRYGKSSGLIIPALLTWDGPVVATSTRGDLLRAAGNWRRSLAAPHGGSVYVYDPFGSEPGVVSLHWSPLAGCTDPSVAYRRASAMVAVVGRGITDGEHWRAGASAILRAVFHAAAITGGSMVDVRRWLASQEVREPARMLREANTSAASWADDLRALDLLGERERGSFYSVARNCLDATAEPRVLASTTGESFDVDHFLATRSTLFIVGPSHYQAVAAPMIVGLVDSIAQRAAELAAVSPLGRLDPRLLLALDEVPNIAPLESLPALVSEGGGRGIVTMWAAQSLAQLRARYGADVQQSILTATTAKLIFGGMSNGNDLRDISGWAGEYRETQVTYYAGGIDPTRSPTQPGRLGDRDAGGRQHAVGGLYRPSLPVDALQRIPPLHAWLFYRSDAPLLVETRPAGLMEPFRARAGYTPDPVRA
ncbi:type IV secretory system conjugative DNA transfer family protein [Micromonospora sp. ALFpr18c]|uniref:type IV secretory system conjugative DNA transfer family protein n=1 Tax=Micromonospora sp. ALFpr18c TaxID=1458665 RepID=UPI001CED8CEA|nr:type IV secretory system conjugative DNA transfer family protein [Micromonospora sp. ALFpr18c]